MVGGDPRWQQLNAAARVELEEAHVPDANEEYLIYQTLVGTWPVKPPRMQGARSTRIPGADRPLHGKSSLREAKLHTSWLNPDEAYEEAVASSIRAILADRRFAVHQGSRRLCRIDRRRGVRQFAGADAGQALRARACPIFIRASNFGISTWSIPTIAGRSIFSGGAERCRASRCGGKEDLAGLSRDLLCSGPPMS